MNSNISPNEIAELAANLKKSGQCNCCQAVLTALANESGVPAEKLRQLGAAFAVGMGTMENTCGALAAAAMILGLKTNGIGTMRKAAKLSKAFNEKCGATVCKELKGIGTGKVLCPCDECVRNAVKAYYEVDQNG